MNVGRTSHPRAESLRIRELLIEHYRKGIVAEAGLIAHGRGEAFDYLLGETTTANGLRAIEAAAATLLLAERPVISVNGNAAALVANDIVQIAKTVEARIEVNLFYRSTVREEAIKRLLEIGGAQGVLGVGSAATSTIEEVGSERRRVDPEGIAAADVILIPLEDGDRTEALVKEGKRVIAVDLNPLSRTAQAATITIVDNVVRTMPALAKAANRLNTMRPEELQNMVSGFDNKKNLNEALTLIRQRLLFLTTKPTSSTLDRTSSDSSSPDARLNGLRARKGGGKIIMLTAYDYPLARILDQTGIDLILVGDSLGMAFQGGESTKDVSMEQMLYHVASVARGARNTPVIADMPIHSHRTVHEAIENGRLLLDVGAQGLKVEGNKATIIRALLDQNIPIMGHVGLLPQTAQHYAVRGTNTPEAEQIFNDAVALDDLGVFAIVLESIPEKLSKRITASVKVPTIGIGAGRYCDGQVLVTADLLGLPQTVTPKYVKRYADLASSIKAAINQFKRDVANESYPDKEHTYH